MRLLSISLVFSMLFSIHSSDGPDSKTTSIQMSIGLAPIVTSIKYAKTNETIQLQLISGLTYEGIVWMHSDSDSLVLTKPDNTVIFDKPGTYMPIVLGHQLHEYYNIVVTDG